MKRLFLFSLFGVFSLSVASCSMMKKKQKDEDKKSSKSKRRYHSELMVK